MAGNKEKNNEIETIKIMQRINDAKSWFFGMINTIYRSLAELIKEGSHMNTHRNE